ncbi:MAG: thiamine phosphate synthase [Gammaproteobacteria bacterium]|nr:thiamine phosphate synthase [Gammaproteobacteria bacterium]
MRGLYAITSDDFVSAEALKSAVTQALVGGAVVIQYRDKKSPLDEREKIASNINKLCHEYGALFIVNDDVELAKMVDADGVHLGRDDMGLAGARSYLGEQKIIGVSCYNDLDAARQAEQEGADYVAFGRFFPSLNKPDAIQVSVDVLQSAHQQITVPIVAIGGITAQNGAPLVAAGADMLAVIDGVFGQPDITRAAGEIAALF